MATLLQTVLLILPLCGLGMSHKLVEAIYVCADNMKEVASFLHESATFFDRVMYFPKGSKHEKLMEVSLRCDFRPGDTIAVRVGLHKGWYNQVGKDIDPRVGIADASGTYNVFKIHDVNDYSKWTPCKVIDGEDDNDLVSSGTPVPAKFRLMFTPRKGYGVCETVQDNGYMNTARFHSVIDVTKPLFLRLNSDDAHEES